MQNSALLIFVILESLFVLLLVCAVPIGAHGTVVAVTVANLLAVYKGLNTKTVDEIRDKGMCLERMKPGQSTLPQAGQGGFAQYAMKAGEMIVPSPVLHIMDKDALALHDDDGRVAVPGLVRRESEPIMTDDWWRATGLRVTGRSQNSRWGLPGHP